MSLVCFSFSFFFLLLHHRHHHHLLLFLLFFIRLITYFFFLGFESLRGPAPEAAVIRGSPHKTPYRSFSLLSPTSILKSLPLISFSSVPCSSFISTFLIHILVLLVTLLDSCYSKANATPASGGRIENALVRAHTAYSGYVLKYINI